MRCTVLAASSKAKALEARAHDASLSASSKIKALEAAAHTASLRANYTVQEQKEETACQLSLFTSQLEEGYRQQQERLRVLASAQISAIAEMKRDVVAVNKLTGPTAMQYRAFDEMASYLQGQSNNSIFRCKRKCARDRVFIECTNSQLNINEADDQRTKRRMAKESEAFQLSQCTRAGDSDAVKRICLQKMNAVLIKRDKQMYRQAFCDAGYQQHKTVMSFSDQRDLKNKYGYHGNRFIKNFLKPFGIKGPCEAAMRSKLKANSFKYLTGSYMKVVEKKIKDSKLTKIVEKAIIWAIVEGFEQALQDVIECLMDLLRWQPGTDASVVLIQLLWDKGGGTTKMALKFPQLPAANSIDNIWFVAHAEGGDDDFEMYTKVTPLCDTVSYSAVCCCLVFGYVLLCRIEPCATVSYSAVCYSVAFGCVLLCRIRLCYAVSYLAVCYCVVFGCALLCTYARPLRDFT
jgi:hypothetical protein